jgi:hypothetical protein
MLSKGDSDRGDEGASGSKLLEVEAGVREREAGWA